MSDHPSLQSSKSKSPNLLQLEKEVAGELKETIKTFIIMLKETAEEMTKKHDLLAKKQVLEQNLEQFSGIISKLEALTNYLNSLTANADLEHDVLTKINKELDK